MKQVVVALVIALTFVFFVPTKVVAQDFDRSWAVWKMYTHFGTKDELVKRNLTKAEAEDLANGLNDNNKQWARYFYGITQSKEDGTTAIRPRRITMPKLGIVDLDTAKIGPKKVPSLAGKSGKGKIGKAMVSFEFQGGGNSGTVLITGELEGKGKWEETGTGALYIETKLAVFRGGTDGKKASGLRFFKDNSQPPTDWNVTFDETAAANTLVGTKWRRNDSVERAGATLEFSSATTMKYTAHLSRFGDPDKTYVYQWKQDPDGSFVINDYYYGRFQAGQKQLEVKRKVRGDLERMDVFSLVP